MRLASFTAGWPCFRPVLAKRGKEPVARTRRPAEGARYRLEHFSPRRLDFGRTI
jgi:hypothetical protein